MDIDVAQRSGDPNLSFIYLFFSLLDLPTRLEPIKRGNEQVGPVGLSR